MAMTQPQGHQKGRGGFKQRVDVLHRKQRRSLEPQRRWLQNPVLRLPPFGIRLRWVFSPGTLGRFPRAFRIRDVILLSLLSGEIDIAS
jgi:hypothetical protein